MIAARQAGTDGGRPPVSETGGRCSRDAAPVLCPRVPGQRCAANFAHAVLNVTGIGGTIAAVKRGRWYPAAGVRPAARGCVPQSASHGGVRAYMSMTQYRAWTGRTAAAAMAGAALSLLCTGCTVTDGDGNVRDATFSESVNQFFDNAGIAADVMSSAADLLCVTDRDCSSSSSSSAPPPPPARPQAPPPRAQANPGPRPGGPQGRAPGGGPRGGQPHDRPDEREGGPRP